MCSEIGSRYYVRNPLRQLARPRFLSALNVYPDYSSGFVQFGVLHCINAAKEQHDRLPVWSPSADIFRIGR